MRLLEHEFDPPLDSGQVVITETLTYERNSRIILTSNNHILPWINDPHSVSIRSMTLRGDRYKGLLMNFCKSLGNGRVWGICSYIPFSEGKKITGFYIYETMKSNAQYYAVQVQRESDIIVNNVVPLPEDVRPISDPITEEDIIRISNVGAKFRKISDTFSTLSEAINYINQQIYYVIDPSYIYKLMKLNYDLCYESEWHRPRREEQEEETTTEEYFAPLQESSTGAVDYEEEDPNLEEADGDPENGSE